jgi:NADP-dependent 3-hydroxy acid dehydrogenase YdfG
VKSEFRSKVEKEGSMTLLGKKALVTGGSRGIGAAIAKTLAAEGAVVAITYEKSKDQADAVVSEITASGRFAVAIQADSADITAIQASVDAAAVELGGLDILVNNAGIIRMNDLAEMAIEDIRLFSMSICAGRSSRARLPCAISGKAAALSQSAATLRIACPMAAWVSTRRRSRL